MQNGTGVSFCPPDWMIGKNYRAFLNFLESLVMPAVSLRVFAQGGDVGDTAWDCPRINKSVWLRESVVCLGPPCRHFLKKF
jgi:hypothetical protein